MRTSQRLLRGSTVALQLHISAKVLREYEREGVLIPLKSPTGMSYFTKRDYVWIATIGRLLHEAHLTFDDLRHALADALAGMSAIAGSIARSSAR